MLTIPRHHRNTNITGSKIVKILVLAAGCLGVLFLSACGGGGSNANGTLTSITVAPATATISNGGTQQYTATGNYSNGTHQNLTSSVTWSSSSTTVATINSAGLATGAGPGSTTITATSGSVSGTAALTVQGTTLTSITVAPAMAAIFVAGTQQFTATGNYSDGTQQNLTSSVTWTSSSTTVATINNAGLATGVGVGTTTITATSGSISGTAQLTVTTNTGGSSSGSTGILILTINGSTLDAAYQPYLGVNGSSVQVVNLDSTSSNSALITSIPMPANYIANATAANQSLLKVVVISYTSSVVQVIDATTNTIIHTFDSQVTGSAQFSGGSCTICGALIDPVNNLAVLDTAQGYYTMDLGSGAFTPLTTAFAAENFSLDSTAQLILSPTYNQDPQNGSEVQILNMPANTISTNTALGIEEPDSAATDLSTGVGVVVDEQGGNQTLINMSQVTVSSGNWSAPTQLYAIPGCVGDEMTMIAADSIAHILFSSEEFGACTAVEALTSSPPSGAPPIPTTYVWGPGLPNTPDNNSWVNGGDPHGVAVFTSVVSGKHYGFLVNSSQNWIARVDLEGVLGATPNPNGIDLTPYVFYLPTTQ
jgi:hypothetical protein